MAYDPLDKNADIFRPPEISTLVFCLHCKQEYDSYQIEWRIHTDANGKSHGFWCCPIPGCDGKGFGFDIFSVDPDCHDERGRWVHEDDSDAEEAPEAKTPTLGESPPDDDERLPW